jgi:hypothetical protein
MKGKITSPLCHHKHIWKKHFYVSKPKFRTISNQTFRSSHYCGLHKKIAQAHQGDPHCNIPHIQYNVHHNNNNNKNVFFLENYIIKGTQKGSV